ncbi:MAG: efflux RND transporter periplasmic adaptor subunit [Rhodospirillales bacterium]|nr:efflux RND transporter periplasmic adaptor subunit [Rhodospirillales bacterium]
MSGGVPDIYRSLLEDLSDGVMAVGFDGSVQVVNPAFCRMFGLDPGAISGRAFGEAFVALEGFDEFTDAVFDAIVKRGDGGRQIVSVSAGGEQRSLSVTTSCLTVARDGEPEPAAVIAVVSDITEVKELRETELRQAEVIKTQLGELQDAYRDLEARNEAISAMRQRVRLARGIAIVFVAGLFLAVGGWYVRPLDLLGATVAPDAGAVAIGAGPRSTMTVEPQLLRSTLSLRGWVAPGRVEEVVSPIEGHVTAVHATHGQRVAAGDPLVEFDTSQLAGAHRRAEIEYIKARDRLAALEDWTNGSEMARARHALRRARSTLEDAERNLERMEFLLEQGIVPTSEREAAQRSHEDRKLDVESAERELAAVAAKGGAEAHRVAGLEAENARDRLRTAEAKLDHATVAAPVAGIVSVAAGGGNKPLARGRSVVEGELLLSIADLGRLSVMTGVDEVDVRKIEAGQRARITGPGFPGLEMEGVVARVSSEPASARRRNAPRFEVVVALDPLDAAVRDRVRVGMSAHVAIVVYERPAALLVPIGAVERAGGEALLQVRNPDTGEPERRAVALGITTLDSVEVAEGLAAGDEIVLPGAAGWGQGGAAGGPVSGVLSR